MKSCKRLSCACDCGTNAKGGCDRRRRLAEPDQVTQGDSNQDHRPGAGTRAAEGDFTSRTALQFRENYSLRSTAIDSTACSPRFSGRCSTASKSMTSPAFTEPSSVLPSG